jgi:hypothetical protein
VDQYYHNKAKKEGGSLSRTTEKHNLRFSRRKHSWMKRRMNLTELNAKSLLGAFNGLENLPPRKLNRKSFEP